MEESHPNCTLARLSFWVPAGRMAEFETIYETRLAPILKKHGLVESTERGRPAAEGVFSRLFEMEGPAAIVEKREALLADPDWQQAVQDLDTALGILGKRVQRGLQTAGFYFSPYQTPAGSGTTVPAGPGRQVAARRGRGRWRTFDATDGLPGGIIRAVLQDQEGYLWIGSWGGGLSRYDGHRFQPFTPQEGLASRLVQSVIEDREGNLWIGTGDQGLFRYDGQGFEHFTTQDGLVADEVVRVFQDREGHIWVGTFKGLSRYDGHRVQNFTAQDGLPSDQVHAIFQDREGYLWFGTGEFGGEGHRGGVSRYDGHGFQTFTTQEGLAFDAVWSILQDREGIFWFGTNGGLSRYDGHRFQTYTTENGLGANNVWSILQDREGALWFGTKGGGVSRYDGKEFTTFTTQDGLGDNSLEVIFQDREGSLWFGTWGGLSRYESQLSTIFTAEDGLAHDAVLAILQDREGVFWFGTAKGLSRYEGRTFTTFTTQDGLADNRVSSIFQDREGNLWFGHSEQTSGKGVTRYDGHSFTVFSAQDGLGSDRVYAILQDQAGNLWFGDAYGASRYDGARFEHFAAADGLVVVHGVMAIVQDQGGVLWFGSLMGLSRYDGHTFTREGLVDYEVFSICQAQGGGLWFGARGGGVLRYDGQSVKSFTTRDGLADDSVISVLCDLQGRTWFGTFGGGVSLYDGQVFQTFTTQEGLGANSVWSILQDQEGNLWFGTTKGVTRYRPAQPSSPPMYIDAVVADRRYEGETEISIPASVKLLAFEFHGISFKTRPEAMIYRYRLEGYEEEWRNTHSRRVEYQDLPVGEYTFQIQAVDRDLNYSAPVEVRLKVIPDPRDARIDELEQRVRERTRELEEKNRALVVEMALERVRGQALGMQKHGDFLPVAMALFRELGTLGIRAWRSGFWIIDRDTGLTDVYTWGRWGEGQDEQQAIVRQIPLLGFSAAGVEWGKRIFEMWRNQQVFRISDNGETFSEGRNLWVEYMRTHGHYDTHTLWPTEVSPGNGNNIPFSHGILVAMTAEPLTDEQVGVLQKFAGVLSLAYTRFLDLHAAEERARQQVRELAVEHVRSEALSMRSSDDLYKVVAMILKEMVKLGVETPACSFQFVDEESDQIRQYIAFENPRKYGISWTSPEIIEVDEDAIVFWRKGSVADFISSPIFSDFMERWRKGETWSVRQGEAETIAVMKGLQKTCGFDRPLPMEGNWVVTNVSFRYGTVGFRERKLQEEHIAIVQDLTSALELGYLRFQDFQRLEEQNRALEQANVQIQEANRHKSQFLSRMSHDLRTPMNAILGYTRILLRKLHGAIDARQYQNLQNIQLSADHLLALINDILDLSRVEAGRIELKLEEVDLKKLVQECAAAVASLLKPGVALRQQLEEVPLLHTDPDRLRRVLMNLLSNAVKFTERGSITVVVQPVEGWVELSVADTGVGIPSEELPYIFEEFRQGDRQGHRPEGSGLGLAIARKSAELLGGSIFAESEVGRGTRFTLRLTDYPS